MSNRYPHIILYDGYCGLCHKSVQWVLKRDAKKQFVFVPLQSTYGLSLLNEKGINPKTTDSIVYIQNGIGYYIKAEAVLKIAFQLGSIYKFTLPFQWIPTCISNGIYDFIAKRRIKWFGEKSCSIPSEVDSNRFVE